MRRVLITGGAGFLASHFVDYIVRTTDWEILLLDRYLGPASRHGESGFFDSERVRPLSVSLDEGPNPRVLAAAGQVDYIIHLGGRTRIGKSIADPWGFMETNVMGTCQMLEFAREQKHLVKFIYFSTDEVYGKPIAPAPFSEESPYRPTTPYGASKIAATEACLAWWKTYQVPVVIPICMSLFGEWQSPEKYVPSLVRAGVTRKKIQIYADLKNSCTSYGDYLHAKDAVSAVMFLIEKGQPGEKYNIARAWSHSNLEVLIEVEKTMRVGIDYDLVDPEQVRPGFYVRYGLNGSKIFKLGWIPPMELSDTIPHTVEWLLRPENKHWLGIP